MRKQARNEGHRYCNPVVLTYQDERMPAELRLQVLWLHLWVYIAIEKGLLNCWDCVTVK